MIKLINDDCMLYENNIPSDCIDLILTDLPYGTVKNIGDSENIKHGMKGRTEWDSIIPIKDFFKSSERVLRKNGKMILFSQQPFTTELIKNQLPNLPFNYSMIWLKDHFANSLIAKKAPVNYFEDILIFSKTNDFSLSHPMRPYFKSILEYIGINKSDIIKTIGSSCDHCFRINSSQFSIPTEKTYNKLIETYSINKMIGFVDYKKLESSDGLKSIFNLPLGQKIKSNVLQYKKDYNGYHPTQKPVALLEDLIFTFSNKGDIVLDYTMGSGSTGVACQKLERSFIGIEKEQKYFDIANTRLGRQKKQTKLF